MSRPNIITKLRDAGLLPRVLGDLLKLDDPAVAGEAVRCVHPNKHKNNDANPSLLIYKRVDGARCQVCNFGGGLLDIACAQLGLPDRAAAAAELERRYLPEQAAKPSRLGELVATYDYADENGDLLYQVCRFERADAGGTTSKTFRIRRPDPDKPGGFTWKLGDARVVPFRLQRVREAIEKGEPVYVAEGEKDVLALEEAGVCATCNHAGAGKWRKYHAEALRGAKLVVIVADKDEPGQDHARGVVRTLTGLVDEIQTVEAKEGKDAADHLAAGHGVDGFVEIELPAAPEGKPERDRTDRGDVAKAKRPEIKITTEIPEVVDQAEHAVLDLGEEIYQRAGLLVRVRRDSAHRGRCVIRPRHAPVITPIPPHGVLELFSSAAEWLRYDSTKKAWVPALPPRWAVDVLVARVRHRFSPLEGVVEAPTLRPDGTILDVPGYDAATGFLYEPNAKFPPVPTDPTREDALAAFDELMVPFSEFPFVSEVDRAAALTSILTQVGRHAIRGPTPLFGLTAPTPGTGKSLLVFAVVMLATGRPPTTMAPTHEDEEFRKVITTVALEGHAAVLFDNAVDSFGSAVLAGALTSQEWSGRVLGFSRTCTAPLLCTWWVTGNNISYFADVYRRVVPIRLDAKVEQPEDREFKITDLLLHVRRERPRLLARALTILRAFFVAGCPTHGKPRMGSFEAWDDVIRSCVVWLLDVDPCAARSALREETDAERETARALFTALAEAYPNGRTFTSVELVRAAATDQNLRTVLEPLDRSGRDQIDAKVIGYALRKFRGRVYDDLRLVRADAVRQGVLWRIVRLPGGSSGCGDDGDCGDDSGGSAKTSAAGAGGRDVASDPKNPDTKRDSTPAAPVAGDQTLSAKRPEHHRDRHHHRSDRPEDGDSGGEIERETF